MGNENLPVCDPDEITALPLRPHEQPAEPGCIRLHNIRVLRDLNAAPCSEIGYCILAHLGE